MHSVILASAVILLFINPVIIITCYEFLMDGKRVGLISLTLLWVVEVLLSNFISLPTWR